MEPLAIDPNYTLRVRERVVGLQRKTVVVNEHVEKTKRGLDKNTTNTHEHLDDIGYEIDLLEVECHDAVRRVMSTLEKFNTVVKQGDLRRLQQKVDGWGPEKRVTREMFKRMLDER